MSDNKNSDTTDWKLKFNDLLNTCQTELKKTTQIGMKMLSASQSNAKLTETYESLGVWLKKAVSEGKVKLDDPDVLELINTANTLEEDLAKYEEDVQNIKSE